MNVALINCRTFTLDFSLYVNTCTHVVMFYMSVWIVAACVLDRLFMWLFRQIRPNEFVGTISFDEATVLPLFVIPGSKCAAQNSCSECTD